MKLKVANTLTTWGTLGLTLWGCAHRAGPAMSYHTAATALVRYDYQPKEIAKLCEAAITRAQTRLDKIAQTPMGRRNTDNTLIEFEQTLADFQEATSALTFMSSVSPQATLRSDSEECEKKASQFIIGQMARRDLYDAVRKAKTRNPAEARLKKETVIAYEKSGLKFSDKIVNEVRDLNQKLSDLKTSFAANLANDVSSVAFSAQELEGVPADFIGRLKKDASGKYIVTTKSTDYMPVMENAKSSETRRRMMVAYHNRQAEKNTQLLEEALQLRQQIAHKLGFKTWADYAIKGRMAKSGQEVLAFLNGLRTKLAVAKNKDLAKLLQLKKEWEPGTTSLNFWDIPYYEYQLKKRDYALDDEKIKEYFPADRVIQGTFDVYSKLLGVKFVEVPQAQVWSPDVKLYEIRNAKDDQLVAHFYADLIPREGKYGHAAAFQLVSGRLQNGTYTKPVSSIVANMSPPANGKPSLMNHDEVETFFHEFGHIMHQTLTKASFASLAGSNVYQDFVEAPSQMLENWVWDKDVLSSLSGHYQDHSKKLPEDMRNKMIQARYFNKGYFYTRQLNYGLFDMRIHTMNGKVDSKKVYDDVTMQIIGVAPIKEGHFPASFGHMMGGYDAGYYGYLWSEVYARDMFSRFQKEGLLNPKTGADYRRFILEAGDTEEPMILLTKFLGRKPNNKAFLKMLDFKN